MATYDLTIGAVGPKGDKGDKSDNGPRGPQGESGEPAEAQFPVLSSCPCWAGRTLAEEVATVDEWFSDDEAEAATA